MMTSRRSHALALTAVLAAGAFVNASCATKAQTGALVGAGGGAVLGGLLGGGKGAAVGAIGGAVAGGLVGKYMDKQEEDLKKVKGANVQREGDKLVVKFNSAILFDSGKASLKPQSQKDLSEFAKVLVEYKDTDLIIEGHTDNKGKKKANEKLSQDRAEAVVAYLVSQGVARERVTAKGFADERPVADNGSEEGRAQNRRVEVQIAANERLQQQDAAAAKQGEAKPASKTN